jgi:hypothetical protein
MARVSLGLVYSKFVGCCDKDHIEYCEPSMCLFFVSFLCDNASVDAQPSRMLSLLLKGSSCVSVDYFSVVNSLEQLQQKNFSYDETLGPYE